MFTCRLPVTLPIERVSPAVQLPSQADKSRRSAGPAAEPPWAAPTARARHVGCISLLPLRVGRGSRRAAP